LSFSIQLYTNSSPSNFVTKTITPITAVTGVLRDGCSIVDPVIEIEAVEADIISKANYLYIEEFGRYYYITDISTSVNGLWGLACHCDVLMTYSSQIKSQKAVLSRQENLRNMYLDDGWFMAYQNPIIVTKYFSILNPFETQEYVLIIAGS